MAEDKDTSTIRDALADMFGLLEYKVRNNVMSSDDMRAILTALEEGGGIRATIHDIAVYYGKKMWTSGTSSTATISQSRSAA